MKNKRIYPVLMVLTLFLPCFAAESQPVPPGLVITPDIQFTYAQELFQQQDHITAQTEFKRFIHFFPDDPRTREAEFKTAVSLYHSEQFYEAAKRFNKIIEERGEDEPYARESYFMQSKAFEAMGNTGYAQLILQNFLKLTEDTATRDRIYLELANIHIQETQRLGKDGLDQAAKYLTLIRSKKTMDDQISRKLTAINLARSAPRKNPTAAGILAVIPGGGMLYCERYKDAFVSFCLNTGLMYAAYQAFNHDNPALGGVITFVESGFYAGNIYGSITAAHKYNKAAQIEILNREFNLGANFDPVNKSFLLSFTHGF